MSRSLVVVLLLLSLAFLIVGAGAALATVAAAPTLGCEFAENTVCDVGDAGGIAGVVVQLDTATGSVLIEEAFTGCPVSEQVSWDLVVPDFEIEVVDCGGAQESVVHFAGLQHRPLGDVSLALEELSLVAEGFDREDDDAVRVELGEASAWEAVLVPEEPTIRNARLQLAAIPQDGAEQPPTLTFTYHPRTARAAAPYDLNTFHHMTATPTFATPTYAVALYRDGALVQQEGAVPNGTEIVQIPEWFCAHGEPLQCAPRLAFGVDPGSRELFWEIGWTTAMTVVGPAGAMQVDQIRLQEEDDTAAAEPPRRYTAMELRGRLLPSLTLYDDVIRPPLPAAGNYLPGVFNGDAADPFGFDALTAFMESDPEPGEERRISENIFVRVVGEGELVEEPATDPERPADVPEGEERPDEPPLSAVGSISQTLRLFNTASLLEFEVVVQGELLSQLTQIIPGTGAHLLPEAGVRFDSLVPYVRTPGLQAPAGWSDGVDNRIRLNWTTAWPWRAIVHFSNNCSGALVGPRHILTAAHCINKRGTNQWYSFTATPGRNAGSKPYGDSAMNPNPQPGDPFRWYFTPAQWRSSQYNDANCDGSCYAASQWDWGLIIIPDKLGYQTGWMGYVARPAGQLNPQYHYNRGYPVCGTDNDNDPAGCVTAALYGDTNTCDLGTYHFQGSNGWHRVIRNSCDLSGGHSGSPVYHYFYDSYLGKTVPVAAMVEIWEHCYQCSAGDDTPNSARRLTPYSIDVISFFRQWKP